jgi:hypothetical protein
MAIGAWFSMTFSYNYVVFCDQKHSSAMDTISHCDFFAPGSLPKINSHVVNVKPSISLNALRVSVIVLCAIG